MDRRSATLLLLAMGIAPYVTRAHAAEKVRRIGTLAPRDRSDTTPYMGALLEGLQELGWRPGANLIIEQRFAEGRAERLVSLAAELLALNVEVIVAATTTAARAAGEVTRSVPVVFAAVGDPVEIGLVQSLAHPGGNMTGMAFSVGSDTFGKDLELLKEAVPTARRVAVLLNPGNPSHRAAAARLEDTARSMRVELRSFEPAGVNDYDAAFAAMRSSRADAVLVLADSVLGLHRKRLAELAAKNKLPAMYGLREYVDAGGLMSYGPDVRDSFRRSAAYVDKILRGAAPGDLPVEQPTKFELVINLATAKALGIAIPQPLLLRADLVIP